ncbi:platelet-activating factor receptor [Betta splendens]|uniref:Platelet-activating factor receptor n=1 Tax=Betta splendens TaxID=158456 RepID=A0A6P7LMI8_BETSP|nr:platelet-activating factor receptor [Betta splendens]XP_055361786.1 platelet-activating factor receptor [Betta splendens]XP_055361787.1 platelet-activating factor receptor [Betta splendens]XP_055361788.1 platelet-activating factor receptor [Betta splendens]XP_055361789.1 platelet-activating factor receptor [Betta splendens]
MAPSTPEPAAPNGTVFLDSEFRYVLLPVALGIISVLGAVANTYVLFVLRSLREAKAMGEIRIYMTNLTIADLLFVCALPFWVDYYSRGGNWVYQDFLCRLTGIMFFVNNYCAILFLGAISVNRYWAVTRPLDAASSDHRRRGIVISVLIWAVVGLGSALQLANSGVNIDANHVTRCCEGYQGAGEPEKKLLAAIHFAIVGAFFAIFVLVVVCNALIARTLMSQNTCQSESQSMKSLFRKSTWTASSAGRRPRGVKRRALQMLWAVVGVFALCFVPHHVVQGPWTLAVVQIQEGWGHVDWEQRTLQALNDAHQITLVLMALNCILDPVVYFFATRRFRKVIKSHARKLARGEGCSQTALTQLSVDSRNQSQRLQGEQPGAAAEASAAS